MIVSVIIRTLNEEKHLEKLLLSVSQQKTTDFSVEIVIVDSGSIDRTLEIAQKYKCVITHIKKSEFTYGRSLNIGCKTATGSILVLVSGHCIPVNDTWLVTLIQPIIDNKAGYTYGRQIGNSDTKFSEKRVFTKYFPPSSRVPQYGFFCNNANSAIARNIWEEFGFNETLTGLEDMYLSREMFAHGYKIAYVAEAMVYHIHEESWKQVRKRYEREAYALHRIMPEVNFNFFDFIMCLIFGLINDYSVAIAKGCFFRNIYSIFMFRLMQYSGSYRGNYKSRRFSSVMKYRYFYPK